MKSKTTKLSFPTPIGNPEQSPMLWIPVFTGMTEGWPGMTEGWPGMTEGWPGMTRC
jgi:hypothetical protein